MTEVENYPILFKSLLTSSDWPCLSWTVKDEWRHVLSGVQPPFRVHRRWASYCDDHLNLTRCDDNEADVDVRQRASKRLKGEQQLIYTPDDDDHNKRRPNFEQPTNLSEQSGRRIDWENEAVDRFSATFDDFVKWTNGSGTCSSSPFSRYPIEKFWSYSSYNYMHLLESNTGKESLHDLMTSIDWTKLHFGNSGVKLTNPVSDARDSVLWIGSSGAYTPCHQDTYGYNVVAQLVGRKLWILFPPSDTSLLSPTRIPYEESSIFSQVNVLDALLRDTNADETCDNLRKLSPHAVILEARDVLFVPHKWWHFVMCLSTNNDQGDVSISVNTWQPLPNEPSTDHIEEAIVRFLATSLFPVLNTHEEERSSTPSQHVERTSPSLSKQFIVEGEGNPSSTTTISQTTAKNSKQAGCNDNKGIVWRSRDDDLNLNRRKREKNWFNVESDWKQGHIQTVWESLSLLSSSIRGCSNCLEGQRRESVLERDSQEQLKRESEELPHPSLPWTSSTTATTGSLDASPAVSPTTMTMSSSEKKGGVGERLTPSTIPYLRCTLVRDLLPSLVVSEKRRASSPKEDDLGGRSDVVSSHSKASGEGLGNEDTLIDDKRQVSDDDYDDLEEESDNEKLSTLLLDSILHPDVIALIRDKLVSRVSEIADRQEA